MFDKEQLIAAIFLGFSLGLMLSLILVQIFPTGADYGLETPITTIVDLKDKCEQEIPRNQKCILDVKFKVVPIGEK